MKNEKNFSIFKNQECLTIESKRFNEYLSINLSTFDLDHFTENGKFGEKIMDCYGIIGIITLIKNSYLIVITDVKLVTLICKREIYKIVNTHFIPFLEINEKEDKELLFDVLGLKSGKNEVKNEDEEIINNLKSLFSKGFYFSNKFDLTNSLASQKQIINAKDRSDYDYILDGNHSFLANWKLSKKMCYPYKKNTTRVFLSNCIYGNIEQFSYDNSDDTIQIILISRRNISNYGISYYKKGLTKEGNNSNQIETELILIQNNADIYSSVYLSGYLPLLYKKDHDEKMNDYFVKFIKSLVIEYNLLIIFLLEEENYQYYVDKFKEILHNNKQYYEKLSKFFTVNYSDKHINKRLNIKINEQDLVEIIGYSHLDNHLKEMKDQLQIGTFFLLGIDDNVMTKNEIYLAYKIIFGMYNKLEKKDPNFLKLLEQDINLEKNAQNENSTIGYNKFLENLKVIYQRRLCELYPQYYYEAKTILDMEIKQRYNDLVFNKEKRLLTKKEEVNSLRQEFSTFSNIKIFVGSWNTGNTHLNNHKDLSLDSWLKPKNEKIIPNIYFIGLQEVVELSTANVISNYEDKQKVLEEWAIKIELTLEKIGKYRRLTQMNLVGINFYFYVLESDVDNINNLTSRFVKTGFGGTAGNKGSCCINFNYLTTSISVACSHLAAGKSNNKQRLKELTYILNLKTNEFQKVNDDNALVELNDDSSLMHEVEEFYAGVNASPALSKRKQIKPLNSTNFSDSDIWIIFGDLNFRIDMEYEEFSEFVKNEENWEKLLEYDQFNKNKIASLKLQKIVQEDRILHPPTYKYIVGTDSYDYTHKKKEKAENEADKAEDKNKSGKKRNPSWCDRIFYKKDVYEIKHYGKIIKGLEYNNVMDSTFQTSDHRPIYNIFDVTVFLEDKDKRKRIEEEVEINEKLGINSKYFKTPKFDY